MPHQCMSWFQTCWFSIRSTQEGEDWSDLTGTAVQMGDKHQPSFPVVQRAQSRRAVMNAYQETGSSPFGHIPHTS